jgi:hypothetical protein
VDTLVAHAHLDTWWETIVMAAGHATALQAGHLLTGILDRAEQERAHARQLRLLAGACLETVRDIDPAVHRRIDAVVKERLVPPRNRRETDSLAAVGHRVLRYLPGSLEELSEARASATVRAAALTGSAEALPLLATYAQDPRHDVQRELERSWQYFDPERFANEVLADAPLRHGQFDVRSRRLLPYVSRLRALTALSVNLDEEIRDLRMLDGVPALTMLALSCGPPVVDLTPLREHRCLRHVWLGEPRRFTRLRALARLGRLTSLNLYQARSFPKLEFLAHTPGLERLALGRVDACSLGPIADLPALQDLVLEGYANRAIAHLPTMERITSLVLSGPVDGGDLSIVTEKFPCLTFLNVETLENLDLRQVAALPLEQLFVPITSVDLRPLSRHPTLSRLYLNHPQGSLDLSPLAGMKLDLKLTRGTNYTGQKQLGPNVKIAYW